MTGHSKGTVLVFDVICEVEDVSENVRWLSLFFEELVSDDCAWARWWFRLRVCFLLSVESDVASVTSSSPSNKEAASIAQSNSERAEIDWMLIHNELD